MILESNTLTDNGALLDAATELLLRRVIVVIREMGKLNGTSAKWVVTDENGEKRTVECSLSDLGALLEKLAKAVSRDRTEDDPLIGFIRRLDGEAASE